MATHPERVVLTYEDYLELPNDRSRYEILEGELNVTPAPSIKHQRVLTDLLVVLRQHVRHEGLGTVLPAPCDVLLSRTTVVQPDLLFVSAEREAIIRPRHVEGPPDLVVEILSPTTAKTDRQVELQLYARHGVPCYWLVDPDRRSIRAMHLVEGSYQEAALAEGASAFSAPPFPDLTISLGEIWK